MSSSLKIISKKSSALMATLMVMLGLAALIGFSAEQSLRFLENQRAGTIDTSMIQFEDTFVQSIQASYYEIYRSTASNPSGTKILTKTELDAIVQEGYSRLGIAGISGSPVTIPHSSGSTMEVNAQILFPNSLTQIDTQSSAPYAPIQGTYSWLDGISAVQKSVDLTLSLSSKNPFSGKIRQISHSYRLNLLEIPVENLSLSSMGNITLPNTPIQAGSGYFSGSVRGGNGVQFQNRLISGNRSESSVSAPPSEENPSSEWSERGYSEIVTTNTVRNLNNQRTPALGTSLKTSYFFREGLASQGGLSSSESSQLKTFQPYYQTPITQRIYGVHNPSAADESTAFTITAGTGEEQNSDLLPTWATIHLQTNSPTKVQFLIDLSQITPDANQEVSVFIGSRNNSNTGPFTQAEVVILPWENIPSDRKITVISPNAIVVTGSFNQGSTPASVHFFANRVYYGSTPSSLVNFEGTYSNYQQNQAGATLNFQASDGSTPNSSVITMNQNLNTAIHRHHHYYYLVIKSKLP